MKFLDNCDFETGQVDNNDLTTPETTETDLVLDMTTKKDGETDLKELISNSITEKIPGVVEDVTTISTVLGIFALTGEIDRTTPGEGEEDPFSNKQKVILDYELNSNLDKIEPSHSDTTRYTDHYDKNKSSLELDKNHTCILRSNLKLILILHFVFLFLCRNTALSI